MLWLVYFIFIINFFFISLCSTGASGNDKTIDSHSVIVVKDNLLTVKVKDLPLEKILNDIAGHVPIKFVFFCSTKRHLVSNSFQLPMAIGLKELLRDYNYSFVYGSGKSQGEESDIRKVIIVSHEEEREHRNVDEMEVLNEKPSTESFGKDLYEAYQDNMEYDKDYLEKIEVATSIDRSTGVLLKNYEGDHSPYAEVRLENIEDIVESLRIELGNEDVECRLIAIEILGDIGGSMSIQALEGALAGHNEAVREAAIERLTRIKKG
ncbi:MAG: HEAT repeat domain-containing protein [Candidatus Scalindua sp.]|nr:HEAT repeat domain-containing protein [Candidatus Scalindua sp.]